MTPEFKAKWVEALRSGKYQQARRVLKDRNGAMCCLGVAADLIDSSQWNADVTPPGFQTPAGFGWRGCEPANCMTISDAIGISIFDAQNLAVRNDGSEGYREHSFAEIADIIEREIHAK